MSNRRMQSERFLWLSSMSSGAIGSLLLLPFWVPWSSAAMLGPLSFSSVVLFTALSIALLGSFCGLLLHVAGHLSQTTTGRIGVTLFVAVPLFAAQWMLTRGAWIQQQWWRWPALFSALAIEIVCVWLLLNPVNPINPRINPGATHKEPPVPNTSERMFLPGPGIYPGVAICIVASILCVLGDRYVLPGLYLPFHIAMILAAVFFASLFGLLLWRQSTRIRWMSPVLVSLLLPVGFWLMQTPAAWGAVSKSVGVGKAVSAVAVAIGVGPRLPSATQSIVKTLAWPDGVARPKLENADIILITIDALRADRLGIYGSTKNLTPNLDALAKKSVVFSRAYAPSPTSSYSLASLFCSRYAFGQMNDAPARWMTLAEHLASSGYRTYATYNEGIFFTDKEKFSWFNESGFGFQKKRIEYMDSYEISRASLANLNEDKSPAFVWLHIAEPHEPYQVRPGFDRGPTPEDRYDAEIWYADRHLEQLLKPIEGRNAIIIVASDHGEAFGEHGAYYHTSDVYAEQAHIPLFMYVPGATPRTIDAPQGLIDLAPTLLDLLGLDPLPEAQGRSLAPLLFGQTPDDAPIFSEWKNRRAIAINDHRLLCDTMTNACELYNIKEDIAEKNDLSMKDPSLAEALASKLNAFLTFQETQRDSFVWPLAIEKLARNDATQREKALPFLRDSNPKIRARVARLMAPFTDKETTDALAAALQDDAREVRLAAALSLGEQQDERSVDVLRALLVDEKEQRAQILLTLYGMKRASAEELSEALESKDVALAEKAIRLLIEKRELTPVIEERLQKALSNGVLTEVSAQALGVLGAKTSTKALIEALQKTTQIPARAAIAQALGQLKEESALAALLERAAFGEGGDHIGEAIASINGEPPSNSAGGTLQRVTTTPAHWRCDPICGLLKPQSDVTLTPPREPSERPYILFLFASGGGELTVSSGKFSTTITLPASLSDMRIPVPKELLSSDKKITFTLRATSLQLSLMMLLPIPDDISTRY
jgi:HEAT repeat protein